MLNKVTHHQFIVVAPLQTFCCFVTYKYNKHNPIACQVSTKVHLKV